VQSGQSDLYEYRQVDVLWSSFFFLFKKRVCCFLSFHAVNMLVNITWHFSVPSPSVTDNLL